MPAICPWSITTSEPMSCCAITLIASSTVPFGGVVNRALPLIRRISLTSIVFSSPAHVMPYGCRLLPESRRVQPGLFVDNARQPQADIREHVQQRERDQLDPHERHHSG